MGRISHFDILVNDIERASNFYRTVFGWTTQKWDGPMEYWFVMTGNESEPGINGGMAVGEPAYSEAMLTLGVTDVQAVMKLARENGGQVVGDARPVQGVGFLAEVVDTEGNHFGLMQDDETAGL